MQELGGRDLPAAIIIPISHCRSQYANEHKDPSKQVLDVREGLDEIKANSYELEAGTAEWEDDGRERISAQWVAMLG